ncbi:MAG TPA: ATP-binding cassette domain-containing protein [Gemmatimonadota bacterium]|nr:ATP-binding cassette domain-containing protein [Gemmatimonadota bacterium]
MTSPAIEIRGLRKEYGDTVAVDGLDLVVPRGSTYALLGPNGSGKTTTIRTLLRIQEPDAGEVRVLGEEPGPAVRDRIGYLPEERGLYPRMKVHDVLTFLAELKGMPPKVSRPRIEAWLERVGLADRADDRVDALSKGMQQKLQFIAAVVHEPDLVILDEPFSGLDPLNQQALREIVAEIRSAERTILFSTHIIEHAERLCDHVCILSRGRAVVDGELGAVRRNHGGRHVGLTLDPWTPEAVTTVRTAPETARLHEDGNRLELVLADGADPRALLVRLVEAGVGLLRFEVVEPSLQQVFIERVGSKPIEEGTLV